MTELNNITGFFRQICGDNNLIDRTDVEEGRLNKNIAKALGIIDENGNLTNTTYTQEQFESSTSIDDLLTNARIQGDMVRANKNSTNGKKVNDNGSRAISQEKCTYKNGNNPIEGTLIRYEDGSLEFVDVVKSNGKSDFSAKFKNEEDFKANRPYQVVSTGFKKDSKGNVVRDKHKIPVPETHITNYEYTSNGKIKHKEIKNNEGVVLSNLENDDDGFLISEKKYSSDGTLLSSKEGFWEDENTRIILSKNGNGEIEQKQVSILKDKKPVSVTIYNKDGGLKSESSFDDNGKKISSRIYHKDGKTIKDEVEFFPESGGYKNRKIYNKEGQLEHEYTADLVPDGKTWDKPSAQGTGDCYLLSSINAIRELDNGEKMLSDLIDIKTDKNGKKTYTVTLPGAKIAADSLKKDGLKVSITGTYTFTEEEFEKIAKKQGSKYSIGNANIILLEAAFEKYRQEVGKTAKDNNIKLDESNLGIVGLEGASGKLEGGLAFDATFVLTGKNSETYLVSNTGRGLDISALHNGEAVFVSKNSGDMQAAGVSSIDGELTTDQEEMNQMLDKVMNDMNDGKKDVIATVGFKMYENGKEKGGHAFTIKEVTEDTVTVVNPWYPEKTITMPRSEFVKTATNVSVSDTSKETILNEQTITPNDTQKHEHKKESPTPERPVTDEDRKAVNDMVHRFFGGGKVTKPNGNKSSAKSKRAIDIMNHSTSKNKANEPSSNGSTHKHEPELSPQEQKQAKKQVSDLIKRFGKR